LSASAGAALVVWLVTSVLGFQVLPSAELQISSWLVVLLATNASQSLFCQAVSAGAILLDWSCTCVLGFRFSPFSE
jgi:hypothetical protein